MVSVIRRLKMNLSEYGFTFISASAHTRIYGDILEPVVGEAFYLSYNGQKIVLIRENTSAYICSMGSDVSENKTSARWVIPKNRWHNEQGRPYFLVNTLYKHLLNNGQKNLCVDMIAHMAEQGVELV